MVKFRFKTEREYEDEICGYVRRFHLETDAGKKEEIRNEAHEFISGYQAFLSAKVHPIEGGGALGIGCPCDKLPYSWLRQIELLEATKEKAFDPQSPPSRSWLEKKLAI